ncbi:Pentatricopeptide repeat-containing protein [Thalictrum thalictroides]|uniref:Pentatricopeptide repeat-containing protein n=1 Tax=Thalictrum thalictroides TaxID=46969 RepID=A0A7J6VY92_THATH|nr:Pentatricopeptide repeat-containing protein [Thalictrum thalictroides]
MQNAKRPFTSFSSIKAEIKHHSTYSFNTTTRAHINSNHPEKAITHFTKFKEQGFLPDSFIIPSLIKLCFRLNEPPLHGQHIHAFVIKKGYLQDIIVCTSLVEMYFKYGFISGSCNVFDEIPQRDVVLWTAMVTGFSQNGFMDEALEFLRRMVREGIRPNGITVSSVLSACSKLMVLHLGRAVHGFSIRNNIFKEDMVLETAFVDMYVKCKNLNYANRIFDRMKNRNFVSWNAIITGHAHNGSNENVLRVFKEMVWSGSEQPASSTLTLVLQVCGGTTDLFHGREIHGYVVKRCACNSNRLVEENALIDMYAKGGDLTYAVALFKSVPTKNLVTWTTMIMGYGMHGLSKEALQLFDEMKESGIKPDSITFIALLSACSHGRLVKEGERLYMSMQRDYYIDPEMKHFACMVDLYGRAGFLEQAYNFIESMPVQPTEFIWAALLSSCKIYKNLDLAEKAAKEALLLNQHNAGVYIHLSRMYADSGRWEDLSKVRLVMKDLGLKPVTAHSWVELERKLYTFTVRDRLNSYSDRMYSLLDTFKQKMQKVGYVSDESGVGHNTGEEEKESDLCGHTEKLTLAFVLINCRSQNLIRIGKNLRVCKDCHETFKFISKSTDREIILKDPNRYHKFKHGQCSCFDFW